MDCDCGLSTINLCEMTLDENDVRKAKICKSPSVVEMRGFLKCYGEREKKQVLLKKYSLKCLGTTSNSTRNVYKRPLFFLTLSNA